MPTQDIEKLIVSLEARTKEYEKALAKAQGTTVTRLRAIEREAAGFSARFGAKMSGIGASMKAGLAGAAAGAVAAFGIAVRNAISDAASIGDLADKIGITTDKLQELRYGAVQANMSFDDLGGGLLKFSKNLGEARNGSGDLLKLFEANGFSKAQVQAMDYGQALDTVADLIRNAKTEQDGLLIVSQAFGKGNDAFLEFLSKGSAGLRDFKNDTAEAGAKIDEALIRKAQELDDRWAALMVSLKTRTQSTVLDIVDMLSSIKIDFANAPSVGPGRSAGAGGQIGKKTGATTSFPARPNFLAPNSFKPAGSTVIPDAQEEKANAAATREKEAADQAAKKAAEDRAKAISDVIEQLQFEHVQLQATDLQQEINNQLRQAGVTATSAQGKQIADLVAKNYELARAEQASMDAGEAYRKRREEFIASEMQLAELGVSAFEAIVTGGQKAADVIQNLARELLSASVRAALLGQGPLASLFNTSGSGGLFGTLFGGQRANGGPVSAGTGYLVGERGPELFLPKSSGAIVPNGKLGGGGTNVQIIDQRSNAPAVERQQDGHGNVRLLIRDAVRGEMAGAMKPLLASQYGITPKNQRR